MPQNSNKHTTNTNQQDNNIYGPIPKFNKLNT